MNFTHLHVHTEYSLLDGSSKISEIVQQAKKLGMDSLAITDHGVMYGVIDFYRAAREAGINPVIGCEVYVAPGSRFDRETGTHREDGRENESRYHHLVLLAENNKGYANLTKIVSRGFTEGFYYKPRVDYEVLEEFHEGIIALSACLAGAVPSLLLRGLYEEACEEARKLQGIFGKDNFFLELQDHGIPEQKTVNQGLLRMHNELGIELVATNDVHYIYDSDAEAHDILLCIQTGKKVSDENRMRYEGGQYYLKSGEEMAELFLYAPEALENTHKIASRCHVEIEFGKYKLPHFDVPEGYTSESYLRELCAEGLVKRYGEKKAGELTERLDYELDTISTMGFVDYFLIVWDFIKYAKDHEIPVGPGRGSAAGSLVAYSLEITDLIDPIQYNLLFERFLNPERVTMPDIDIDFCYERRQEVIDYVNRKYGEDHVVQIVTFGTMSARMVIRDVGRVLDYPYAYVDSVAKAIPMELDITIQKALKMNPELRQMYEVDEQAKKLIDMSLRLEGLPRHTSVHAAGVVISPEPVDEFVPLSRSADGGITTQYTKDTLEELGLLKMDFLGLRTLTVIDDAVDGAFDIRKIDYADPEVFEMISAGHTEGVFQLESAGMKNFMKELKPQNMEDIIAGISLYRPGPMDFIPKYIQGKNNQDNIQYDCPELEPILAPTYGCIVYQEQVMQIVRDLAGYSYGRSDLVRRAMSKKKASVMEKEKNNFIYGNEEEGVDGCIRRGIPEEAARKIFDDMTDFAKYAFNKSHAAAYAVVSYQTAYLKCHYPVEFMAALMTSFMEHTAKITGYIMNCRQLGIEILPPDINEGEFRFTPHEGNIRYGLAAIKGVGKPVIDEIVAEREAGGPYRTLKDFCLRLSGKSVNRRTLESFIKAGALDSLPGTRKQKMMIYTSVVDGVNQEKKNTMTGQMSLFDFAAPEEKKELDVAMPDVGEYDKETILAFEKEVLGVYISGHPLEEYITLLERNITRTTADFIPADGEEMPKVKDEERAVIGGMITGKTVKTTRTNNLMAFITVEDLYGTVEVIVFPKDYEKYRLTLEEDRKVFVKGRVTVEEDKPAKLICSAVLPFDEMDRELWIQCKTKEEYLEKEAVLFQILAEFDGRDGVNIFLSRERAKKRLPNSRSTKVCRELLEKLYQEFGSENVKVVEKSIEKSLQS
ncbi:MAG: DNA polymerase III subunit alpha [Eubacterium sp.]|nr:DNA polymerase III subunit alpha [Eubacterium sp.]